MVGDVTGVEGQRAVGDDVRAARDDVDDVLVGGRVLVVQLATAQHQDVRLAHASGRRLDDEARGSVPRVTADHHRVNPLQHTGPIYEISYANLTTMSKLRSTYDGRY